MKVVNIHLKYYNFILQVFTNKNIFDLTTASSTRSDTNKKIKSIKPVTPHFKIDNSLKIKIRIQTSNITPEIISRISTKRSYQLQIKASKKSVHQVKYLTKKLLT